jgi:formamidopyrimidine-DNA glycosylase
MPELPEVETMVRGIRGAVEGRTLESFRRCRCRLRPLEVTPEPRRIAPTIMGQMFTSVRRFAKRVVLDLSEGGTFVIEPRMTGLMLLSEPPSVEHLRVEWRFVPKAGAPDRLWFWDRRGLGTVRYYAPGEFAELVAAKLGPDALQMDPARWRAALGRTNRPVKVALLDQKLVAGIGNLYASEILFLSRIDPQRAASSLTKREIDRLAGAAKDVLETAILHEGSTLSDGTYRNALAQNGRYQNSHRVYAKAGKKCPKCKTAIIRIVQAQRSTFYCTQCQR